MLGGLKAVVRCFCEWKVIVKRCFVRGVCSVELAHYCCAEYRRNMFLLMNDDGQHSKIRKHDIFSSAFSVQFCPVYKPEAYALACMQMGVY